MLPARLPKERVPRTFTWIAPTHDLLAAVVDRKARRLGLQWLGVEDGEDVLEVAVGTGLSFRHLLRQNPGGWTCGIDLTPAMLRRARQRARRAPADRWELRIADAYDLPYPAERFDALLCCFMFDLLPEADFVPVLREFRRALRPGGRLVLVSETTPRRWYERGWQLIYRLWPPLFGGCRGVRMAPHLREAGYERVRRTFTSHFTFPAEVVSGEKERSQV
jgi:phosphatidylethanolamine/phosphatidyl-N-methylethanolamine N-methyltransferase